MPLSLCRLSFALKTKINENNLFGFLSGSFAGYGEVAVDAEADAAVGDNEIEISLLIAFNIYN